MRGRAIDRVSALDNGVGGGSSFEDDSPSRSERRDGSRIVAWLRLALTTRYDARIVTDAVRILEPLVEGRTD